MGADVCFTCGVGAGKLLGHTVTLDSPDTHPRELKVLPEEWYTIHAGQQVDL